MEKDLKVLGARNEKSAAFGKTEVEKDCAVGQDPTRVVAPVVNK
jgi:hypothetical protein